MALAPWISDKTPLKIHPKVAKYQNQHIMEQLYFTCIIPNTQNTDVRFNGNLDSCFERPHCYMCIKWLCLSFFPVPLVQFAELLQGMRQNHSTDFNFGKNATPFIGLVFLPRIHFCLYDSISWKCLKNLNFWFLLLSSIFYRSWWLVHVIVPALQQQHKLCFESSHQKTPLYCFLLSCHFTFNFFLKLIHSTETFFKIVVCSLDFYHVSHSAADAVSKGDTGLPE